MSTIVLAGAFGQGNPGDEALCSVVCRSLHGQRLLVASGDPAGTEGRHGVEAFPATAASTAAAVRRADAVVVAGGTVFKLLHRSTRRHPAALLRNTAALIAGAHLAGAPVALVGVGAGELHGRAARRLSGWIARRADLVVLRDEESAAVLSAAGVPAPFRIGADLAWLDLVGRPAPRPRPRLAGRASLRIAVSHLAGGLGHGRLERDLAAALASLGSGWSITIEPWQDGDGPATDLGVAQRLGDLIPGSVIADPPRDLFEAYARLSSTDVLVGMRFHSLVAAGAAGVPFVALAHEPKLTAVARRLDQVAVPPTASASVLAAAIDAAMRRPPPSPGAVRAEADRARITMDLVHLMLNDGAIDHPADLAALPLSTGGGWW